MRYMICLLFFCSIIVWPLPCMPASGSASTVTLPPSYSGSRRATDGASNLFLHQQGLDTSTPSGRAMFQIMGVFAEFERAMIRERVLAGLARARARDAARSPGRAGR